MKGLTFIVLASLSFFTSCVKEVNLNLDELPQQVVVNGLICPDSLFKVHATLTSTMEAEKELINNATIKVFENGIYSSTLSSIGEGWYQGDYPNIEVNYKIEVTVPGFEMVYAETSIPKYPVIIDTFFEKANSTPDEHGSYESKTTIIFQDDPNQVNFYHAGRNNYFNDHTKETDPSILSESDLKYNPLFYVFSDILFQGKVKNLTIMAGGSISLSPFGDGYIFYQDDYKRDFGPVSKEYYLGIKSWTQHYFNQNNDADINDPLTLLFKGEPTEMYSNIQGGFGVFAGYNFQNLEIEAHE